MLVWVKSILWHNLVNVFSITVLLMRRMLHLSQAVVSSHTRMEKEEIRLARLLLSKQKKTSKFL